MSLIYYPYFRLSKITGRKFDHKKYITLLSLFSDGIMIPIRHILEMGDDEFDILLSFAPLFEKGYLYYRLPRGISSLHEYYIENKSTIDTLEVVVEARIQRLESIPSNTIKREYDPVLQKSYYSSKIKSFLHRYFENHKQIKKSYKAKIDPILSMEPLSKEDFDNYISRLKDTSKISKNLYMTLQRVSNIIYFVAGSSEESLKICYDTYFDSSDFPELAYEINDYTRKFIRNYDPAEMLETLASAEIISNNSEIDRLTARDIIELKDFSYVAKVIKKYCSFSGTNRALSNIGRKRTSVSIIPRIKELIITIVILSIAIFCSLKYGNSIKLSVTISIISTALSYIIIRLVLKHKKRNLVIDKLLNWIIGLFAPETMYLFQIQERIRAN